jgi:hypothetical protein
MEFERVVLSPVMNTNEIPIKLPERYTRGDDRFHVIHEDDINDDSKEGEKNIPHRSFFLSFFRVFTNFDRFLSYSQHVCTQILN